MVLAEAPNLSGKMFTLKEAADILEMHPDTLRQQAGRNVLNAKKYGRDWLVPGYEIMRYAQQHRRG